MGLDILDSPFSRESHSSLSKERERRREERRGERRRGKGKKEESKKKRGAKRLGQTPPRVLTQPHKRVETTKSILWPIPRTMAPAVHPEKASNRELWPIKVEPQPSVSKRVGTKNTPLFFFIPDTNTWGLLYVQRPL